MMPGDLHQLDIYYLVKRVKKLNASMSHYEMLCIYTYLHTSTHLLNIQTSKRRKQ